VGTFYKLANWKYNDWLSGNWYEDDQHEHHHHHHYDESTTDVDNGDYFDLDVDSDFSALIYASDNYSSSDEMDAYDQDDYDHDIENIVDSNPNQTHLCECPPENTDADRSGFENSNNGSRPNDPTSSARNDPSLNNLANLCSNPAFIRNLLGYPSWLTELGLSPKPPVELWIPRSDSDNDSNNSINDNTSYSFELGDTGNSSSWGGNSGGWGSGWGGNSSSSYSYSGGGDSGGWSSGCGGGGSGGGCGGGGGGGVNMVFGAKFASVGIVGDVEVDLLKVEHSIPTLSPFCI
jgi:hypothetical protein